MSEKNAPTRRILHVLQMVSLHGPITLGDLTQRCDFSRAAIWRALDALRAEGWVRMRLGDNAYVVRQDPKIGITARSSDFENADEISRWMAEFAAEYDLDVVLAGFDASDELQVLESTRKSDYQDGPLSLVNEPLAMAAQLTLDKVRLVAALRKFLAHSSHRQRQDIHEGQHAKNLHALRHVGVVWSQDSSEVAVPVPHLMGEGYALAIRSKTNTLIDTKLPNMIKNLKFLG